MTRKILILDDDVNVRAAATRALRSLPFEIVATAYAGDAATLARQYDVDLIMLGAVEAGGMETSSLLRQAFGKPVLPLFRPSVHQRSRLSGVDFGPELLLALSDCRIRIGQHLETRVMPREMAVCWGDFTLTLQPGAFAFRGQGLGLTRVQAAILSLLMLYSGEIVGKDMIEDVIFRGKPKSRTNFISVHISRLREKLRDKSGGIVIENVRASGYALFWNSSFSSQCLPEPQYFMGTPGAALAEPILVTPRARTRGLVEVEAAASAARSTGRFYG